MKQQPFQAGGPVIVRFVRQPQEDYEQQFLERADEWALTHEDFLCAVFDYFRRNHHWPTPRNLQRDLDRKGDGQLDVYKLARELPSPLGPSWRGADGDLVLRIRALRRCPSAQEVLSEVVPLLRLAHERYLSEEATPQIRASDLGSDDQRRAAYLLQRDSLAVIYGPDDTKNPDWVGNVNTALVREVRDVRSLDNYLAVEAAYFRSQAHSRAGLLRQSVVQGVSAVRDSLQELANVPSEAAPPEAPELDRSKVFVVHGRNESLRDSMFSFLRALGLQPIEWGQARRLTGDPTPYVGAILDAAFKEASAVVVLMTPDDISCLRQEFRKPDDPPHEAVLTGAARPNVIFEAGMAMGRDERRTVLVECGRPRPFSDIGGRHVLRLDNSSRARQELAHRLQDAGCAVNLSGDQWHTVGDFTRADDYKTSGATPIAEPPVLCLRVDPAVEGVHVYLRVTNDGGTVERIAAEVLEVAGIDRDLATPWPMRWRDGDESLELPPTDARLLIVADGDGLGNSREFRGTDPLEVGILWFRTRDESVRSRIALAAGSTDLFQPNVSLVVRFARLGGGAKHDVRVVIGFVNEVDPYTGNLRLRADVT